MNILGISAYFHDSAACLVRNGRMIAAIEEERLNRVKHSNAYPELAISECLRMGGITQRDLDHVAYFADPWIALRKRVPHILRNLPWSLSWGQTHSQSFLALFRLSKRFPPVNGKGPRFHFLEHHLCHAASSFFVSPFEEAAIFTVDGVGEWPTALFALGSGTTIKPLKRVCFPHSLGKVYTAISVYLGFEPLEGEGKVMGLAAYGKPHYYDDLREIIQVTDWGFEVDVSYLPYHLGKYRRFSRKFVDRFGAPREPGGPLEQSHMDMAASLQKVLEETILTLVTQLHKETGQQNLCLAGGVALNSVMNGAILERGPFRNLYVQPAASDGGAALGAAYYVEHAILNRPRVEVMTNAYTGPEFSSADYQAALEASQLPYVRCAAIETRVAELIAQGKLVGWFQGRMELGPRALGNRSLLADPRRPEMKEILNAKIKRREWFRPFAPTVLQEACCEFFESDYPSPFMLLVYRVRPDKRHLIAAVTHVDGTARVQTVRREDNPRYYGLISEFKRLTGVPIVLNTSFNGKGEPIVCTPQDAVKCYIKTGLDVLALGEYLVEKRKD